MNSKVEGYHIFPQQGKKIKKAYEPFMKDAPGCPVKFEYQIMGKLGLE